MAKEIIRENHPLNDTPLSVVYPVFGICACGSDDKDGDANEPLLHKHDDEEKKSGFFAKLGSRFSRKKKDTMKLSEAEKKEDPFLQLGFGMIAYRDLLQTFIWLFSLLTLFMIPAFYFYNSYDGIQKPIGLAKLSLGNMGYSSSQCSSIPTSLDKLYIQCPFG